jgi:hypothetical protein
LFRGLKYLFILEDERKLLEFEILMSYALQGAKDELEQGGIFVACLSAMC